MFDQLATAFMFPEYHGGKWDAFNDWIGDLDPPQRSALLWHDADLRAAVDAEPFGEACAMLSRVFDACSDDGKQAELILAGNQQSFCRPDP